jgi:serine kinase of HPr protein (carbohydrate metabolism regulator)
MILHAGLVARRVGGDWRGALIEGPPGAGKSDLALRAIDAGWTLIADDRTLIWVCEGKLYGRAPEPLGGLIEARGLGVVASPRRAFAQIALIVVCAAQDAIERLPEEETQILAGVVLPVVRLAVLEASAPVKLGYALGHLGLVGQPAYQAARAGSAYAGRGRGPVRISV